MKKQKRQAQIELKEPSKFRLFIRARLFSISDFFYTLFHYWTKIRFFFVDFTMLSAYFFQSPYRIARKFHQGLSPYGETPFKTMKRIADKVGITPVDTVYELGSGRGRCCFFLAMFYGCIAVGFENVPKFVEIASIIKKIFRVQKVSFFLQDIFDDFDLSGATVIYLYGTCLSDEEIVFLAHRFAKLKKGTKIITISYSLCDYVKDSRIKLVQSFEVAFQWGTTTCYEHVL